MDCRGFQARYERLVEGRLSDAERHECERHALECPDCAELWELAAVAADDAAVDPPAVLTGEILRRTSGTACASALPRLCDHVDGVDEALDRELMRSHLAGCEDCAGLARALVRLNRDLPTLAELDPGEDFARAVMARTLPARTLWNRWVATAAARWRALTQRPRFALEGAYLGTLLLAIVYAVPFSPLAGLPGRVASLGRIDVVAELREPMARVESDLSSGASTAWRATGGKAYTACRDTVVDLAHRSAEAFEEIREELRTIREESTSEQKNSAEDRDQGEKP